MLERCQREHGGLSDGSSQSFHQFRPEEPAFEMAMEVTEEDEALITDEDDVADICDPLDNFRISDGNDLVFHNLVSPFRHIAKIPPQLSRFPEIDQNATARYVLLAEDLDQRHYNPDFDWARHLPPEVRLERAEHDR
jgi:hypothetical protein